MDPTNEAVADRVRDDILRVIDEWDLLDRNRFFYELGENLGIPWHVAMGVSNADRWCVHYTIHAARIMGWSVTILPEDQRELTYEQREHLLDCWDCGKSTGRKGLQEYYMLNEPLWYETTMKTGGRGMYCIGCFEKKIGRELEPSDFSSAPVNDVTDRAVKSDRLRNRLGLRPCDGKNSNVCVGEGCFGEACVGNVAEI